MEIGRHRCIYTEHKHHFQNYGQASTTSAPAVVRWRQVHLAATMVTMASSSTPWFCYNDQSSRPPQRQHHQDAGPAVRCLQQRCRWLQDESVVALANGSPHLHLLGIYHCQNITDWAMYSLTANSRFWSKAMSWST